MEVKRSLACLRLIPHRSSLNLFQQFHQYRPLFSSFSSLLRLGFPDRTQASHSFLLPLKSTNEPRGTCGAPLKTNWRQIPFMSNSPLLATSQKCRFAHFPAQPSAPAPLQYRPTPLRCVARQTGGRTHIIPILARHACSGPILSAVDDPSSRSHRQSCRPARRRPPKATPAS
jgi:hypothetical protein